MLCTKMFSRAKRLNHGYKPICFPIKKTYYFLEKSQLPDPREASQACEENNQRKMHASVSVRACMHTCTHTETLLETKALRDILSLWSQLSNFSSLCFQTKNLTVRPSPCTKSFGGRVGFDSWQPYSRFVQPQELTLICKDSRPKNGS